MCRSVIKLIFVYPDDELGDLEYWRDVESDRSSEACSENESQVDDTPEKRKTLALSVWLMGFLLTLQARFYLPDKSVDLLIKFLSAFLVILAQFSPPLQDLSKDFPCSLYLLRKRVKALAIS